LDPNLWYEKGCQHKRIHKSPQFIFLYNLFGTVPEPLYRKYDFKLRLVIVDNMIFFSLNNTLKCTFTIKKLRFKVFFVNSLDFILIRNTGKSLLSVVCVFIYLVAVTWAHRPHPGLCCSRCSESRGMLSRPPPPAPPTTAGISSTTQSADCAKPATQCSARPTWLGTCPPAVYGCKKWF
jgi:hypothetical protein